jgi:hypothetical protein
MKSLGGSVNQQMAPARRTAGVAYRIVLLALLAAASVSWIAALSIFDWGGESGTSSQGGRSSPAAESTRDAPVPAATSASPGDYTLRSGELLRISAADLPTDRPLELDLVLGEPSAGGQPLAARLVDETSREIELRANPTGDQRMSARLAIEPGWLRPGTYLIHLRTTERTPLPLRRYPFEVR